MTKDRKKRKLDIGLLILGTLVFTALVTTMWKGGVQLVALALTETGGLLESVWLRLLMGLMLGGLIQVLIPHSLINKWLGPSSGLKGILLASYTSIFISGNPYMWLPVVASIYRAGAGVGPVMALITARAILSLQMLLVWQIPFFGVELPIARYIVCLFVPPIVGLAGNAIYRIAGWPFQITDITKDDNSALEKRNIVRDINKGQDNH